MHPDARAGVEPPGSEPQPGSKPEREEGEPAISVVVASRNRCGSLARLLRSLERQADPPAFEVVVADNGSTDDTPELLTGSGTNLRLRSVRVDRPGKGKALNAAIQLARGQLLVLTDDDVAADPDWLSEIHRASLQHPRFNVFGGRVDVDRDRVPRWVARSPWLMALLCSEHGWDDPEEEYPYGKYPFGPNMAVRRALLVGLESPYPEDMGPGTALPVGDERAFLMKVSPPAATDRLLVSTARVRHEVRPEYFTLRNAFLRSFHAGRSHGWIDVPLVPPRADGRRGSLMRLILERIQGCGSVREFICFGMRQGGFLWGRRERARRRRQRDANPTSDSSGSPSAPR